MLSGRTPACSRPSLPACLASRGALVTPAPENASSMLVKRMHLRAKQTWLQILVLPLAGQVTSGKVLTLISS